MSLHPLDPLTPGEISESSRIIRKAHPNSAWIFNTITLKEPPKSVLTSEPPTPHTSIPRRSFVLLIEKGTGKVTEATVNLTEGRIETLTEVPSGNQPALTPEDCFEAERIAKIDGDVQKRCAKLGFEDMDLVTADPWSVGYLGDRPEFNGKRMVQLLMYARMYENDNHYAHPLDFVVLTDIIAGKVLSIEDLPTNFEFHPSQKVKPIVPRQSLNYDPELLGKDFLRKDVKPLQVVSPNGPSFHVNGNEIEWQKFKMRISFNYREGLVLHNVFYKDEDRDRPLLYRASLAEMAVPYADPRPPFHRKCAFDIGDYGLGFCTNSLELGCDCLGTIKYFDGVLNDHAGEPFVIKNAVCLHEEDAGVLFKHTEYRNGRVTVARSRRLVLSFIVTVVNYEYAVYWNFYQDGTITFDMKATGELSTNLISSPHTGPTRHGTTVAENISGQFHQHIFAMRLDPIFDGPKNTVSTVDVVPLEAPAASPENPYGQGFTVKETVLKTTEEGKTDTCAQTSRVWKISNSASINEVTKEPVAWKLIPSGSCGLLAKPGSYVWNKARFAQHSLWVTLYDEDQRFPSGFYILNQSEENNGISEWTKDEKDIENQDIVLWHVFGLTHIPRIEDFPIMPMETTGFSLKPHNFFTANPALDVPPQDKNQHGSISVGERNGNCCEK